MDRLVVLGGGDSSQLVRRAGETFAAYRPAPNLRAEGMPRGPAEALLDEVFGDQLVVRVAGKPGGQTRLHAHDSDQVLIITAGTPYIATEAEEHTLSPGTVVFVPAGVPHRHGTTGDTDAETIYITKAPYATTVLEADG